MVYFRQKVIVALMVVLGTSGSGLGQSASEQKLQQIERLSRIYDDPGQSHIERAKTLEQIIATYQELAESAAQTAAPVNQVLVGEIQWRLAQVQALLVERTRQSRFIVEELGLGGVWAEDLGKTLDRVEPVLSRTEQRLEQLTGQMRQDPAFERNYVVTGWYLRAKQAKDRLEYYWGCQAYYRSLLASSPPEQSKLLSSAVGHLRQGCAADEDEPAGQGRFAVSGLRRQAVLMMSKTLRLANRLADAEKLLNWLDRQRLDEQIAYESALQRCRLLRDQGHYDTALTGLEQVRQWCTGKKTIEQLPVQLTLAYLECTIQTGQAKRAWDSGNRNAAREFAQKRLEPLEQIYRQQQSEQVRNIIYEQVRNTQLAVLDIGQASGLEVLSEAVGLAQQGQAKRALELLEILLARTDQASRELRAEILWQAGKAAQGVDGLRACEYLDKLAEEYPQTNRSQQATILAVQISAKVRQDKPQDQTVQQVCFSAMQRLMSKYPGSPQAKDWRFYWADLLWQRGELAKAAEQFGEVSHDEPLYVQGRFYELDCQKQMLAEATEQIGPESAAARLAGLAREFVNLDRYVLDPASPAEHRNQAAREFGARARLAAAQMFCGQLNEPVLGLNLLATLESDYADRPELFATGRRYRIAALSKLGQLDEATKLTVRILNENQDGSVEIGQTVLQQLEQKFADLPPTDLPVKDRELAQSWVELARAMLKRIGQPDLSAQAKLGGQETLGRALFAAGQLDEALQVAEELNRQEPNAAQFVRLKGRILLAKKDYAAAAQCWTRLIQGLKPDSPEWFEAWYWALRTNYQAGGDKAEIARRIKQLQELNGEMGSKDIRGRFETLLRKLEG